MSHFLTFRNLTYQACPLELGSWCSFSQVNIIFNFQSHFYLCSLSLILFFFLYLDLSLCSPLTSSVIAILPLNPLTLLPLTSILHPLLQRYSVFSNAFLTCRNIPLCASPLSIYFILFHLYQSTQLLLFFFF
jgi:hypothetical protein